jgi:demethoxyubiquinone hydroxylase (CLK1/Coq7/Cat5 family)
MSPDSSIDGDRVIEVNHAGEHGAVSIYSGQMAMAGKTCSTST